MKCAKPNPTKARLPEDQRIGLPEFERPDFLGTLKFPVNITQLDAASLSGAIAKFTAAYAYACSQRARYDMMIIAAESREYIARSQLFKTRPALITTLERNKRDAILDTEPEIVEAKLAIADARAKREWAYSQIQAFEKMLMALNRELTRKMSISTDDYSEPGRVKTHPYRTMSMARA